LFRASGDSVVASGRLLMPAIVERWYRLATAAETIVDADDQPHLAAVR
jgi:hypothetical protein